LQRRRAGRPFRPMDGRPQAAFVGGAADRTRKPRRGWAGSRAGRRRALGTRRPQARHQGGLRRRFSRALCRDAPEEARLFPHQRQTAPPRAGRADRRGLQKNFEATLKAHLAALPLQTPVEIWFQMLCRRAPCKMRQPKNSCNGAFLMTACTNSRPVIHIALELSVTSWVIAYRLPGSDKVKMHRMSAGATEELLAVVSDLRGKAA